ncbi:TonB-dependent receptor [Hymenobacter rigui]|uniref:TonB-dependent receptor plug domain-containing protein n=1 Tax=Hymenobacter rigui TaxID=334424 RepID=A0A3R9MXP7_9BACT|nr:TonB-dependent receptor plug domain-containing protein [Hymenobacter rigui]RSK51015.1 hypothetical protein EI291_01470 [Hymenobacter rigui]
MRNNKATVYLYILKDYLFNSLKVMHRSIRKMWVLCGVVALIGGTVAFTTALPDPQQALQQVRRFYAEVQPEVSYLHLNQEAYAAGETLWFKAYVVGAETHQLDTLSKVLYVDVISPQRTVAFCRTLHLNEGLAEGDIVLPDTLSTGIYTIRAYTSWMRNWPEELFFTRRVPVWQAVPPAAGMAHASASRQAALARQTSRAVSAAALPDVQFFPEGGNYVQGAHTIVGVKAVAASGQGLALQGTVYDDTDQAVVEFKTPALGMSSFAFTPQPGRRYQARVTLPDGTEASYPLPDVQASGWLLTVRDFGNRYIVYVRRPGAAGQEPLQVVAHVRGTPVYAGAGTIAPGETFSATIPKERLPAGLVHVSVLDGQNAAQAERLVFSSSAPESTALLQPDKSAYDVHQPVTLEVAVQNAQGQPTAAELSLAVASETGLPMKGRQETTIQAHLLLTSELRGYVENPAWYFQGKSPEKEKALDDLLLTQGWSRFVWREILGAVPVTSTFDYPLEQTLSLGGQLVRSNGKPVPNGQLTVLQKGVNDVGEFTADAQGNFLLLGFPGVDSARVLLQARTSRGGNNVLLRLWDRWPVPGAAAWQPRPPLMDSPETMSSLVAYGQRSRRQQVLEKQFRPDTTSGIVLRNVTIRAQRPASDPRSLHATASAVLRPQSIPGANVLSNIFELIRGRVAGVEVLGDGQTYSVRIRGMASTSHRTSPMYLLDGMPLDSAAMVNVPIQDVDRVEVLKGATAAIYGMRGQNGVIAVFTRIPGAGASASNVPTPPSMASRRLPAYYRAREFYAPRYELPASTNRPDPRLTTLYWQPTLHVPASGKARVTFYTADAAGAFVARLEGITHDGQPVQARTNITVSSNH